MSLAQPRGHVYIDNRGIFTSHNIDSPPPPLSTGFDPSTPHSAFQTHWLDNRYPWLALAPRAPGFSSESFDVLHHSRTMQFPDHRFGLDQQTLRRWSRVEDTLTTLCNDLKKHESISGLLPPSLEPTPVPTNYGFRHLCRSSKDIMRTLDMTRAAFAILMSWATFLLLSFDSKLGDEYPSWLPVLSALNVDNDFVTLLRQSEVWQKDRWDRVGVVFDDICQFPRHARAFMTAGVPIWIFWGRHHSSDRDNLPFEHLRPTDREIDIARQKTQAPFPPLKASLHQTTSSTTSAWGQSSQQWSSSVSSAWGTSSNAPVSYSTSWGSETAESLSSMQPALSWGTSSTAPSNSWENSTGWGTTKSSSSKQPALSWGTSSTATPLTSWEDLAGWGTAGSSSSKHSAPASGAVAALSKSSEVPDSLLPPVIAPAAKKIKWGERQLPNEGWREFFARRTRNRAMRIRQEDTKTRQSRLAREKVAREKRIPGKQGPRVFLWEKDEDLDVVIRKSISWEQIYGGEWGNYSDNCKVYDSIANEWDIVEELADCPARPWGDDDDDDDLSWYFEVQPSSAGGRNVTTNLDASLASRPTSPNSYITPSNTTPMASDIMSAASGITSTTSNITSTASDITFTDSPMMNLSAFSTTSDLTSSSTSVHQAPIPIPPDSSSLNDAPISLGTLTAPEVTFSDECYDSYTNFSWRRPVFVDWAYERWGFQRPGVEPLPSVEMKSD